jgi:TRAP-type C4-dicarboxylate transport system permease small subunit
MREMAGVFGIVFRVISILNHIGGAALTFMMFLTVCDVTLRAFGHPIMGTFEIVSQSLAIVIGFGIPKVSADRGHVYMEFVTERLSRRNRAILQTFTRIICIALFILIAYNLIGVGNEFRLSGEVTSTIRLPFFPLAYAVGICCFLQVFVFLNDIINIWGEEYE